MDESDSCNVNSDAFTSETNNEQCMSNFDYTSSTTHDTKNESSNTHDVGTRISDVEEDVKSCPSNYLYEKSKSIEEFNAKDNCTNKTNAAGVTSDEINNEHINTTCDINTKELKDGKIAEFDCPRDEDKYSENRKSQNYLQINQLDVKYESPINQSTETIDTEILDHEPLPHAISINEVMDIKQCFAKNELYNNNRYLKDSNPSVNIINNGVSQTNLITDFKQHERVAPHWKQFMAAMGPYIMIFAGGLSCGFSATLLPQLKEEESVILVDHSSPSWIASMAALPMAPGCFIGGWIIEKWGRRNALRILSIPFFVGWILIATASNLPLMLVGRFLNGISIGMLAPPMSVFVSETSHPKLRGMFLAFLSFSLACGIFVAHLIGTWVSWSRTAAICSVFPLLSAGLLTFVPESPMWLFSKGRNDEAVKSFYWLRGYSDEVMKELKGLIDKFKSVDTSSSGSFTEKFKNFNSPQFFKPLVIMIIIYVTCQFSGVHTITFYSVSIIETAVGKGINKYVAMLTIDFLRVVTTLLTIMTSRKFPRRSLCIVSGTLTAISMMSLAIFLYFYKEIPEHLTALPLCFLSAYIVAVNIGLMPLPWIIVGEIFPANVRSFGAGLASAIGYTSTFVVVKTAPGMMVDIGQVATFMFYGTVALVGTAVLFFVLPETKGRSMLEIEALFKKVKNNNTTITR